MLPTLLLDVNFTPYIPTTVLGLLGLVFAYLFFYYRNKDNNRLKQIEGEPAEVRNRAVEAQLNEIGVHIDTASLTGKQKHDLLVRSMTARTRKYMIIAITIIILAIVLYFLLSQERSNGIAGDTGKDRPPIDTSGQGDVKPIDDMYYRDADRDNYGDPGVPKKSRTKPEGYVSNSEDCCDNDPNVYDKTTARNFYADADGDGYGNPARKIFANIQPAGMSDNSSDCDDLDSRVYPGQAGFFTSRSKGGSFDYNCDGKVGLEHAALGRKPASKQELIKMRFVKRPGFNCAYIPGWIGYVPIAGEQNKFGFGCNDGIIDIRYKVQGAN